MVNWAGRTRNHLQRLVGSILPLEYRGTVSHCALTPTVMIIKMSMRIPASRVDTRNLLAVHGASIGIIVRSLIRSAKSDDAG
ncbi:hypothetical protein D9619_004691 [Psilocybe cf. subviscida]|uniref:Uncharacterized protein n=1 Tax=Psilocybe cf. subviscida TaxID=2480587 RepID=A0A8H5BQ13_9AGAR|nr:hypothetical protein D9619_004691 [Psilocybe cf. subviscida]